MNAHLFESLQKEVFNNLFKDISTPDRFDVQEKEHRTLRKPKQETFPTTPLSSYFGKANKVSKELRFSPMMKAKKINLENVIDKISGRIPAKIVESVYKTPVKLELKDVMPKTVAKKPRGRPRKKPPVEQQ